MVQVGAAAHLATAAQAAQAVSSEAVQAEAWYEVAPHAEHAGSVQLVRHAYPASSLPAPESQASPGSSAPLPHTGAAHVEPEGTAVTAHWSHTSPAPPAPVHESVPTQRAFAAQAAQLPVPEP